ncbi:hypothetical protein HYY27_08865 [bacterium]|nr:hypothetical protein [bacterium]
MADERGATIIGGTEAALKAIHEELAAFRLDTHGRLSRLETGFDQMDKRVSNLENMQRWALGIMFGSWITLMLAVLGLYFKR